MIQRNKQSCFLVACLVRLLTDSTEVLPYLVDIFFYSQLSMKFILFKSVNMPFIVGILAFRRRINDYLC